MLRVVKMRHFFFLFLIPYSEREKKSVKGFGVNCVYKCLHANILKFTSFPHPEKN